MLGGNLKPTPTLRVMVFLVGDLAIWVGALYGAFLMRFDGDIPPRYLAQIPPLLSVLIPVKLVWSGVFRLYQLSWRSVGFREFLSIVRANTVAVITVSSLLFLFRNVTTLSTVPRSVLLADYFLTTCGIVVFRASRRWWQVESERFRARARGRDGTRLLIIGAGAAGTRVAQSIRESGDTSYYPVGFVDDDPGKKSAYVHGLKVFGGRSDLTRIVRERKVDEVLIAIPSAPSIRMREIVEDVRQAGLQRVKVIPGIHELLAGRVTLKDVREINLQDLLPRAPVTIQYDALKTYLVGKRVLVTGSAGSIGAGLVRQLARFDVEQVVALDSNESGLFELEQEVKREVPNFPLRAAIGDVRDHHKMEWLMSDVRPHLVFHAADYKHVPMMERDLDESVKTNIFGTM